MITVEIIDYIFQKYKSDRLKQFNINSRQALYLIYIYKNSGIIRDDLEKLIYTDRIIFNQDIVVLEKEGYVLSRYSPFDKKLLYFYPTNKTGVLFRRIIKIYDELDKIIEPLDFHIKNSFNNLLK